MEFITYEQLEKDIIDFSRMIPPDIDVIVGVERSGLLPAALLALHLNKPLLALNEYIHNVVNDYIDSKVSLTSVYKALIIDDSVSSGRTFERINGILKSNYTYQTAAMYISENSSYIPDFYYRYVNIPRMFEWNFIHHEALRSAILDIDGVIFQEPPVEDNTLSYEEYIKNPLPLYIPSIPVDVIITGRLKKYREITERTLEKYGIEYNKLIMSNYDSPQERRGHDMGEFKGIVYKELVNTNIFIESSKQQADTIREISKKDVICIEEFRGN